VTDADQLLRRFAIALCLYREARGESHLGKLLIAQVIENRVQDPRWPNTYVGVITQPWQFSSFNRTDPNVTVFPHEHETAWADCVAAADAVLATPTPFTTANHYCVTTLHPAWRDDSKRVATEGAHAFFTL
jgi:spore germination cell wall hydrolase CwlJ-like protein